jgi:hypothetical protein
LLGFITFTFAVGSMKNILLLFVLFYSLHANAQYNLVPNGSFEQYYQCPSGFDQFNGYVKIWFDTNTSSDYFNSCGQQFSQNEVPESAAGYQNARTGSAYAGLILYIDSSLSITNQREYIEIQLYEPLQKDSVYCAEFYVVLAETWYPCRVANIGLYFSVDTAATDSWFPTDTFTYHPQIENDTSIIINDTTNWVRIDGYYKALGGEKFITIGNFYTNHFTFSDDCGGTQAYYYIDDVGVYKSECGNVHDTLVIPQPIPKSLIVFPNPNSSYFDVQYGLVEGDQATIEVYNLFGQEIISVETNQSLTRINTNYLAAGMYIIRFTVDGKIVGTVKWVK